ncbi:MAG TPA: cytochrome c biogenesis protein DipZ [Candidatus Saccharimonadales bacterium]|nr:cytochrome c biogenesis protein DipZ [Candidatus Saccharimonadales bacterium]
MLLYLLAFVGGVLTIVSPCILPVLPFVFSRADQSFRRSGLPLLLGMATTFAAVAGVATFAGAWVVRANQIGRILAIVVFAVLGLALLFPSLAEYLTRPLVRLGGRVQGLNGAEVPSIGRSLVLGMSTGLLWAPCAGPILGLILTGAALQGPSVHTTFLLLSFSAGAASSLAMALLAGNKVFAMMKRSLGAEEWIRRGIGVAVLIGVVAIALGWDTGILRRLSLSSTSGLEQKLLDRFRPVAYAKANESAARLAAAELANEGTFPSLDGAVKWLNSPPLTREQLRGKVVLIDFWTYSCINCLRSVPYVEAWAEKYKNDGLVVIGVHTPEFAFEKDPGNVLKSLTDLKITYPVAIDSKYAIWKAFHNEYWPAHYFIDANGIIRYHHFGEGKYDESEEVIQELLRQKNANLKLGGLVQVAASGSQAAPDLGNVASPETYIGYARQQNYVSPQKIRPDESQTYSAPARLTVNQWGLAGSWNVSDEHAALVVAPGKVIFRFHARNLHLVLGPGKNGKPVRFRVRIDGTAPGEDHGGDTDEQGAGIVKEYRLYQLIRQKGKVEDRTFEIEFLDPGVQAFAFTFG